MNSDAFQQYEPYLQSDAKKMETDLSNRMAIAAEKVKSASIPVCTTLFLDEVIIEKLFDPRAFLSKTENKYLPEYYLDAFRRGREKHQVQFRGGEVFAPFKRRVDLSEDNTMDTLSTMLAGYTYIVLNTNKLYQFLMKLSHFCIFYFVKYVCQEIQYNDNQILREHQPMSKQFTTANTKCSCIIDIENKLEKRSRRRIGEEAQEQVEEKVKRIREMECIGGCLPSKMPITNKNKNEVQK